MYVSTYFWPSSFGVGFSLDVQDTKGLISRTFELQLEPGTLDYDVPQKSYVPKVGIWEEYPRHLEDEDDTYAISHS